MEDQKKGVPHKGEGHRQRLRDRFLKSGLDGFQDYEVIGPVQDVAGCLRCSAGGPDAGTRYRAHQSVRAEVGSSRVEAISEAAAQGEESPDQLAGTFRLSRSHHP